MFAHILFEQPENFWISPECKPWCKWTSLNLNKSIEAFENTMNQQREHLWQIAIVQVLFEYQVERNKHCHIEQPEGSKMLRHPSFVQMSQIAKPSKFDMCSVGDLSHPQTFSFFL